MHVTPLYQVVRKTWSLLRQIKSVYFFGCKIADTNDKVNFMKKKMNAETNCKCLNFLSSFVVCYFCNIFVSIRVIRQTFECSQYFLNILFMYIYNNRKLPIRCFYPNRYDITTLRASLNSWGETIVIPCLSCSPIESH